MKTEPKQKARFSQIGNTFQGYGKFNETFDVANDLKCA
jgi:hypothetical protein